MSHTAKRSEREREVLAELLNRGEAYKELPEDFSSDWFESHEFRTVYEKLLAEYFPFGKFEEFKVKHPELKGLLAEIVYGAIPLDGNFKAKVAALNNHKPVRSLESQEQLRYERKRNEQFQFELLNGKELCQMEIPEQSFLVRNLLSEHSVNFLSGEEGCGKSLLAMNLALSIAVGAGKWLAFDVVKQGKVLYLNNELAFTDFARRLKMMSNALPAKGDISNFIVPKEVPALNECWDTFNETCERERPCLIIVDCLYFSHDKDENDSSEMKALMRQFLALRDRYNLALLLIHHTKKAARYERMHNDQMRGSNVFGGITDTVLQMRRSAMDESKRIIKPTKFRHVSDENRKCRLLSLNPETLWFKDEGETDEGEHIASVTQTAEEEIDFKEVFRGDRELSRKQVVERCQPLGYDERTIDRLLKKAKNSGTLKVPRYGYYSL
jgi:hypothetical protein